MELEEKQELHTSLPVLPRLDRLDRLVQHLEEKHSLSAMHISEHVASEIVEPEDHRKTLSSALDEVHHKGTLMERLDMLEKRVFELSLDMDEGKYSQSSSSNVPISGKIGQSSGLSSFMNEVENVTRASEKEANPHKIEEKTYVQASATSLTDSKNQEKQKRKAHRKWPNLFRVVCSRY